MRKSKSTSPLLSRAQVETLLEPFLLSPMVEEKLNIPIVNLPFIDFVFLAWMLWASVWRSGYKSGDETASAKSAHSVYAGMVWRGRWLHPHSGVSSSLQEFAQIPQWQQATTKWITCTWPDDPSGPRSKALSWPGGLPLQHQRRQHAGQYIDDGTQINRLWWQLPRQSFWLWKWTFRWVGFLS